MAPPDHRRGLRQKRDQEYRSPPPDDIYPEYSRDPNELGEGFERRGWRPGSDYYGNNPEAYGIGAGQRGRGPKGYLRSDERIREDVCEALTSDAEVDASNIEVTVEDREVTLSGAVDSRAQKRRAEDLTESVSGVTQVNNNLRVTAPPQW
nr:BON domain-containing protein [uncultured Steroidobacter sp.]